MERSICIHGHFYQPPRENPWLERIEVQDSAFPYHDWNERIMAECYAPNSAARHLDGHGRIVNIVSNYEKISFNFGPTLLLWMEQETRGLYSAILEADARSVELHSGHGNAISQVYNHMIMPLANTRDKRTQIVWGIADFEHRFRRFPEGMWLSETAVDLETLDLLAEHGILYTVLAPRQAWKVRKNRTEKWKDVSGGRIDPTRPYVCLLPSGRRITLFFYDGPISQAVAFEKLLSSGERFANRLVTGFSDTRQWHQLLNIATDGESYGHHHKFGDMALAYALHYIEEKNLAKLTNYGEYLAQNPAAHEVQIYENSSWSCIHGVERWRSNCGCNSGGYPVWNQEWRAPLRTALDWLRELVAPLYETKAREYLTDPWDARDGYIHVILKRSQENIEAFFTKYSCRQLTQSERTVVLEMMEMQRHAMLMYTSCGWFFDELSGIETIQVVFYAGRVIQLTKKIFGLDIEKQFKEQLSRAKSNIPHWRDGARIYDQIIKPTVVDLEKVAAHFAISSFLSEYAETSEVYSYSVRKNDYQALQAGEAKLRVGNITINSTIALDSGRFSFVALHLGGHIFNAGVRIFRGDEAYQGMKNEIMTTFQKGDIADMIRYMDQEFGLGTYSLMNLFRDEQHRILDLAYEKTSKDFEDAYRHLYEDHRTLMNFMREAGMPAPRGFLAAVEFTLIADIRREFKQSEIEKDKIRKFVSEATRWNIQLDTGLEFMIRRRGEELIARLKKKAYDNSYLLDFLHYMELLRSLPIDVNYWLMQNMYFEIAKAAYEDLLKKAKSGSEPAAQWVEAFRRTGELLFFDIGAVLAQFEKKAAA